ncbi:aldehyde dehydrogenase family protein [Vibrio sp. PP-XX7]
MAYTTTNPYTGELIKTFANATNEEVEQAISQAHDAFLSWRETTSEQRSAILKKQRICYEKIKENTRKC